MSSMVDELLAQISPDELAAQLGTDPQTAMNAARAALPTLLGGLAGNAETADGRSALASTLAAKHDGSLLDNANPLGAVDPADGQKIVNHVLGGQTDGVMAALGSSTGAGSDLMKKLLPLLAPLVLAWLSKRVGIGGGGAAVPSSPDTTTPGASSGGAGGGIGDILGQILGKESASAKSGMPDLGSIFDILKGK